MATINIKNLIFQPIVEKKYGETSFFLIKHISGNINLTDRNIFFQYFFTTKNS